MVYVPRDDHGRLLRVEYQPFVGITDNQYTDLPEAARTGDLAAVRALIALRVNVNSAQGVVVTQDLKYAFVTGFNSFIQGVPSRDPDVSTRDPAGGNVGIMGALAIGIDRRTAAEFSFFLAIFTNGDGPITTAASTLSGQPRPLDELMLTTSPSRISALGPWLAAAITGRSCAQLWMTTLPSGSKRDGNTQTSAVR